MMQPEGFITKGQENKVYKLKKALYGLKQASLAWNKQAHESLIKLGFKRLYSDTGVYINLNGKEKIVVILYVDDIIFAGSNKTQVIKSKKGFMQMWECRDLGVLKEYLGMNISKDKKGITIDQIIWSTKL